LAWLIPPIVSVPLVVLRSLGKRTSFEQLRQFVIGVDRFRRFDGFADMVFKGDGDRGSFHFPCDSKGEAGYKETVDVFLSQVVTCLSYKSFELANIFVHVVSFQAKFLQRRHCLGFSLGIQEAGIECVEEVYPHVSSFERVVQYVSLFPAEVHYIRSLDEG
jgi:hypothetical protein